MKATTDGSFFISMPHQFFEPGYFKKCEIHKLYVLHDGEEIYQIGKGKLRQQVRISEVPFNEGVKEIEIIGTYILSTSETYGIQCFKKFQHEMNPREQITSGFSLGDIICKKDLEFIIKISNNSPACVKSDTKSKLIDRGWTSKYWYAIEGYNPVKGSQINE